MDEKTIRLFDNYISGKLSEIESEEFRSRLETNEALAASFQTYTDLNAHLENKFSEEREQTLQTIRSINDSYEMGEPVRKDTSKVRRLTFIKYGIAASVAVLFGLMLTLTLNEPSYEDYAFDEQINITERSGDTNAFAKAEKAFNLKNYKEAITHFDAILATESNAQISYYKAIALTELNRFDEGASVFEELSTGNSAYKYQAQFYHALNLLKQDKNTAAAELLKTIPRGADVYDKAQKLYKRLE